MRAAYTAQDIFILKGIHLTTHSHIQVLAVRPEILDVAALMGLDVSLAEALRDESAGSRMHAMLSAQRSHTHTMLSAKQGLDSTVVNRLAAQFSMATNQPGSIAVQLYQERGWDGACEALLKEHDFLAQMGAVCLWSETEGGWWVQDFGWADSPWAAAGYAANFAGAPARPGESWVLWSDVKASCEEPA